MSKEVEINRVNDLNLDTQEGQNKMAEQLKSIAEDPSINKPSEEEIEQFKTEYEEASQEFAIKRWDVGSSSSTEESLGGDDILNYLQAFSQFRYMWKQNEWMGILKLQEELEIVRNTYLSGKKKAPINFGYQALEFILSMLKNPGGIGLESAETFAAEVETYAKVFDLFGGAVKAARQELQDLDFAQQKWAAAAQGFYLEREDGPVSENEGGDNGTYFDDELGREVSPGEEGYNIEKFQSLMQEKYAAELKAAQEAEAKTSEESNKQ